MSGREFICGERWAIENDEAICLVFKVYGSLLIEKIMNFILVHFFYFILVALSARTECLKYPIFVFSFRLRHSCMDRLIALRLHMRGFFQ